jgi:hypothetical protein
MSILPLFASAVADALEETDQVVTWHSPRFGREKEWFAMTGRVAGGPGAQVGEPRQAPVAGQAVDRGQKPLEPGARR